MATAHKLTDAEYMKQHALPQFVEGSLQQVVKTREPRPYEKLSLKHSVAPIDAESKVELPESQQPKKSTPAAADISALGDLDFDVFTHDIRSDALLEMTERIFDKHKILSEFSIPTATFRQWLKTVRFNYHNENPFHNFRHAFNVMQTMHVFLETFEAGKHFSTLEKFALLFSCLCHDLQHPGVNNKFLINTCSDVAVRYNNISVLENHHSATAFAILNSSRARDVTATLKGDGSFVGNATYRQFREMVTACILSTDVSTHKKHTTTLKSLFDAEGVEEWKKDVDKRLTVMCSLVEAADVSNEIRNFAFSRQWAPLVQEEFWQQGDEEKKLGIPVAPMMEREKTSLGSEQQGFIAFLCVPLYTELCRVFPLMDVCLKNLQANKDTWIATEG